MESCVPEDCGVTGKDWFLEQAAWVQILPLPLTSGVTLGASRHFCLHYTVAN